MSNERRQRQIKALQQMTRGWKDADHPELKCGATKWVQKSFAVKKNGAFGGAHVDNITRHDDEPWSAHRPVVKLSRAPDT